MYEFDKGAIMFDEYNIREVAWEEINLSQFVLLVNESFIVVNVVESAMAAQARGARAARADTVRVQRAR